MTELERALTVRVGELEKLVEQLQATLAEQKALIETLQARLGQNSRNSSKPPSSDGPKAPKRLVKQSIGKKRGAQPGHPGHHRTLLPEAEVDAVIDQRPTQCPHCQLSLPPDLPDALPPQRHQVSSLPLAKPIVKEYRTHSVVCPNCRVTVKATDQAPKNSFDGNTTALVALLHGRYRLGYREVASFLAAGFGLTISLGQTAELCHQASEALDQNHQQTVAELRAEPAVNVDETTWKQAGEKRWAWVATGKQSTIFLIGPSRRGETVDKLLGVGYSGMELAFHPGIITSDRFSGYYRIPLERRQICWAHLKRDFQALSERSGKAGELGKELLEATGEVFVAWKKFQQGEVDRVELQAELDPVRDKMQELLEVGKASPPTYEQLRDFLKVFPAFWRFSEVEGIEPTNNAAERALRPLVIWRKTCYGAFSDWGNHFVERLQSLAATCRQRGEALLPTLARAIEAAMPTPTQTLPRTA